jgi:hypothetical protein
MVRLFWRDVGVVDDQGVCLFDPKAVFVVKPGRVTDGPMQLRAALHRIIELRSHLILLACAVPRSRFALL